MQAEIVFIQPFIAQYLFILVLFFYVHIATKQHSVGESDFIRRTKPACVHPAQDAPPEYEYLSPPPLIAQLLALSFLAIMILNFISYCDKYYELWSQSCPVQCAKELSLCARARGLPSARRTRTTSCH